MVKWRSSRFENLLLEDAMGFDWGRTNKIFERAGYACEACGRHWTQLDTPDGSFPLRAHSAYSWHTIQVSDNFFKATSTPDGFKRHEGKLIEASRLRVYALGRPDDGFCLCFGCHVKLHSIALKETKRRLPHHKGRNAIPDVLEEMTIRFVATRGKMTF